MTLRDAFIFKIEILFIYKRIMSVSLIDFYGPIKIIFVIIKSNKPKTQLLSSARKLLRSKIMLEIEEAFPTVSSTFAFI